MPLRNTPIEFGRVTRAFHWLTAGLIFLVLGLGLIANRLPYDTAEALAQKAAFFSAHKTFGVLTFFVALARILWAFWETHPRALHPERKFENFMAQAVHWTLYTALVAVPLTGWLHHAAVTGFAPIYWPFGQTLPFVPQSEALGHLFGALHWVFAWLLVLAIGAHVLGAVKHHVIDRDATLRRMTRGLAAGPVKTPPPPSAALQFAPKAAAIGIFAAASLFVILPQAPASQSPAPQPPAMTAAPTSEAVNQAGNWQVIDGVLSLEVSQMGQKVSGSFANWQADISFDPEATGPSYGQVNVTIDTTSLTLGSVTTQAQSKDFFDIASFPQAVFTADIVKGDGEGYLAQGTLDLRGVQVVVALPFTLILEGDAAEMSGRTSVDRRDFGMGPTYTDEKSVGFGVDILATLNAKRLP